MNPGPAGDRPSHFTGWNVKDRTTQSSRGWVLTNESKLETPYDPHGINITFSGLYAAQLHSQTDPQPFTQPSAWFQRLDAIPFCSVTCWSNFSSSGSFSNKMQFGNMSSTTTWSRGWNFPWKKKLQSVRMQAHHSTNTHQKKKKMLPHSCIFKLSSKPLVPPKKSPHWDRLHNWLSAPFRKLLKALEFYP